MIERLAIYHNRKIYLLSADDISCVEGDGSYCIIKLKSGQSMRIAKNLKLLLSEMPRTWVNMFRVQRSWLVNLNYVEYIYNNDKNVWILHLFNGLEVPSTVSPDKVLAMFNSKTSCIRKRNSLNTKANANTNKAIKKTRLKKVTVSKTVNDINNIQKQQDNNDDYILLNL